MGAVYEDERSPTSMSMKRTGLVFVLAICFAAQAMCIKTTTVGGISKAEAFNNLHPSKAHVANVNTAASNTKMHHSTFSKTGGKGQAQCRKQASPSTLCKCNYKSVKGKSVKKCEEACRKQKGCKQFSIGGGVCRYAKSSSGCCEGRSKKSAGDPTDTILYTALLQEATDQ